LGNLNLTSLNKPLPCLYLQKLFLLGTLGVVVGTVVVVEVVVEVVVVEVVVVEVVVVEGVDAVVAVVVTGGCSVISQTRFLSGITLVRRSD
jgi:hypothetical protein